MHSNCDTTWVLGVLQGSPDRLYAYLIDEDGLHDPVQSELGHRYFLYAESGADLIVLADFSEFGLYTFDPESGEIDFLYSLPVAAPFNPVRAHLSPDRSKLYVVEGTPATTYTLYQYDLAAGGQARDGAAHGVGSVLTDDRHVRDRTRDRAAAESLHQWTLRHGRSAAGPSPGR